MRKLLMAVSALALTLPVTANAAFFTVSYTNSLVIPGPGFPKNEFKADFAALGFYDYATTGASITLAGLGMVKFEFFAAESGNNNRFSATGIPIYQEFAFHNHFASGDNTPINLGTAAFNTATFNPTFFSHNNATPITPGSGSFGIALPGTGPGLPIAPGVFTSDSLWFMLDDNPGQPNDDNHDDMIVRATFIPSAVPEPATWAMMLFGFGMTGAALRRRAAVRKTAIA